MESIEKAVVLIVEDEVLIRMGAVHIVRDAGFAVVEARNADEAIRILESRSDIGAVFTDVKMGGTMDGLNLAHAVKGRWPPIHLIVTSGLPLPRGQQLPENGRFIRKPYSAGQIINALQELFGLSSTPDPTIRDTSHKYGKVA